MEVHWKLRSKKMIAVQLLIYVILVVAVVGYKGKCSFKLISSHGLRTIATIGATMSLITTISSGQTHNPSLLNNDSIIFQSIGDQTIALSLIQSLAASVDSETPRQLIQSENYIQIKNIRNNSQSSSTTMKTIESRLTSINNNTSNNRFIDRIQQTMTTESRLPSSPATSSEATTSATSLADNFGNTSNISSPKIFNEVISTQLMNKLYRIDDIGNINNANDKTKIATINAREMSSITMDFSVNKQDHQPNMTTSTKLKQNVKNVDTKKKMEFISKHDTNISTLLLSTTAGVLDGPVTASHRTMVDDTLFTTINDKRKILLTKDNNESASEMVKTTPFIQRLNDDSVVAKSGTVVSILSSISNIESRQRMNFGDSVTNFSNQTKTTTANVRQYFKQNAMGNHNQTRFFLFRQMTNETKRNEDWTMKTNNLVKIASTQLSIATGESVQMRKFENDSGIKRNPMLSTNVNFRLNSNSDEIATSVQSTRNLNDDPKTTTKPNNATSSSPSETNEKFVNMNDDNKRWNDESKLDPIDTHTHRIVDKDLIMAYEQSKPSGLNVAEKKMSANKKTLEKKKRTGIEAAAAVVAAIPKLNENKLTNGNNPNNSNGKKFNSSNLANEIDRLFGRWVDDMQSNPNKNDTKIIPISLQTNSFENEKNQQHYNAKTATTQSIINDEKSIEEQIMNVTTSGTDKTINTNISTDGKNASSTNIISITINTNDSIDQMTFVTSMPVPFDEHNGISLQYEANATATHVLQIINRKSKQIDEDILTTENVHISTIFNGNANAPFPSQSPMPTAAIITMPTVNSGIASPLITSFENDTMKRIKRPFNIISATESTETPTIPTKLENLILLHTKHLTLDHLTTDVSAERAGDNQFIVEYSNATAPNQYSMINNINNTVIATWPVKHAAIVEGDVVLGGLMMVHSREDSITCGPIMPQGGIQALEVMLYTLDRINEIGLLPNFTLGAHILDDCDKDTYGLEMAVDFIKGNVPLKYIFFINNTFSHLIRYSIFIQPRK